MMTGVREETEEEPPHPGPTPVFPSKEEFACIYRRQATPVSSVPNHLLPLSCYMSKLLTLAQTCIQGLGASGNASPSSTPINPGRCSPGASGRASSSPAGSHRGSTSPGTEPRFPNFTSSELRDQDV